MTRKRRKSRRPEMLSRNVSITSFRSSVSLRAVERRGEEPEIESQPWLELRGTIAEPLRDTRDVEIHLYPREQLVVGTARPASVGSIIQIRPRLSVVATFTHAGFDRVWALALGGQLKYAYIYFTEPHYSRALVVNLSVSNEFEE
jgi:hypothetical protein